MTTLPATIPGLVRRGSPVRALQAADMGLILPPWDYWPTANEPLVIVNYGDWGYRFADRDGESRHAGAWWFVLDLTDPTGFHHALLWLAEKLGMDASAGVLWYWDAEWGTWYLQAKQRGRRYVIVDGRAVPCGAMEIPPASQEVSPTEALRLAVLTVAGVEG